MLLPAECKALTEIWSMKSTEHLMRAILLGICHQNKVLAQRLYGSTDMNVLSTNQRIITHATNIKISLGWFTTVWYLYFVYYILLEKGLV